MPHFTNDGYELFYREAGEGPVLVLLPGNTASSACYAGEIEHFADRFRVVAMDFRGTGQSGRMERWPLDWWSQAADDTVALLDHLGVEQACLVGSSGGAAVALMAAQRAPERMTAVIADSCARCSPPDLLRAEVVARSERSRDAVAFWRHAHGEDWEQVVEADSALLLRFAEERAGEWFDESLSTITAPVLITASLQDEVLADVEAQIAGMLQEIPDARAWLVNSGGHPMMWSRRAEFRMAADAFLAAHTQQ